jgi:hypothetical protein
VGETDRAFVNVEELKELRQPALGAEVGQHAFRDHTVPSVIGTTRIVVTQRW